MLHLPVSTLVLLTDMMLCSVYEGPVKSPPESAAPFGFTQPHSNFQLIVYLSVLQLYCFASISPLSEHRRLQQAAVFSQMFPSREIKTVRVRRQSILDVDSPGWWSETLKINEKFAQCLRFATTFLHPNLLPQSVQNNQLWVLGLVILQIKIHFNIRVKPIYSTVQYADQSAAQRRHIKNTFRQLEKKRVGVGEVDAAAAAG